MSWYLAVMKNYADFRGRARRKEYWMFALINMGMSFVLSFVLALLSLPAIVQSGVILLFALVHLVPGVAVGVRRMHDIDRSGLWLLIGLVPILGAIGLLIFALTEGTAGPNRFGADPRTSAFAPGSAGLGIGSLS